MGEFVRCWTRFLGPVEPVSSRLAVFLNTEHAEALLRLTTHGVATTIIGAIYGRKIARRSRSDAERELETCFDACERHFPDPAHVVVALLCQMLLCQTPLADSGEGSNEPGR